MSKRILINPVTRISGFMEIDVTLEQDRVSEARTSGNLFRGFEQILTGRSPLDAIFLTQRICGICSAAHSVASATALEAALGVRVTEAGRYLRDLLHGCEFLQNHLRHFYQYTLPDYVKLPQTNALFATDQTDFRLPNNLNQELADHYFESLPVSRLAHQMQAVIGGKAPHNHGIFVGGVATPPTTDQLIAMRSLLREVGDFIRTRMLPDVQVIARHYPEYFKLGKGPGNLLSFGLFHRYDRLGTLYVEPLVWLNGKAEPFQPEQIREGISSAWYQGATSYAPFESQPQPDRQKPDGYSWVKSPRYGGLPCEVGPLARLWLSGEYRSGISAMDRTIARVLEAEKIATILVRLLDEITPGLTLQQEWQIPRKAAGAGLIDTTRGALGHWLKIDEGLLSFYQIITPSAWNFSSRDEQQRGTAEQALIGTPIRDPEHPAELGRILRSFDPCISCATHLYRPGAPAVSLTVLP